MPHWLKSYGWLKYDEEINFMYCDACTKFKRKNSLQQSEEFFVWKTGFMRVLTGLIGF